LLTARWLNLVLVNYRVPPELLLPHVPPGSVLDTPDDAPDTHLFSVVAFHFADSAALRIPIPTAGWFPEINLRFYVRRGDMRATVFLREYVTHPLIALGARLFFNQPYYLAKIRHEWEARDNTVRVSTDFRHRKIAGTLRVNAENRPYTPPDDSDAHFLKEHYWGFHCAPRGKPFRYQVEHPVWRAFPVTGYDVDFDPGSLLGGEWRDIPWRDSIHSVLCAEGSPVKLHTPESLFKASNENREEDAAHRPPG
jgi:uncharacterized protein YqjF (DUF2071 family)